MFGSKQKKQMEKVIATLEIHWELIASKWKYVSLNPMEGKGPALLMKHTEKPTANRDLMYWEGGSPEPLRRCEFDHLLRLFREITDKDPKASLVPSCCLQRPLDVPGPEVEAPEAEDARDDEPMSFANFLCKMSKRGQQSDEDTKELIRRADEFAKILLAAKPEANPDWIAASAVGHAREIVEQCNKPKE